MQPKPIPFTVDRSRRGTLAAQIASRLEQAINTRYYGPGEALPPVRALAATLGVSKGMVEKALAILRESGRVSPRPRVGSIVCARGSQLWKGHVLIVVPPGIGNPFDNILHAALRDALVAAGYLATAATVPRSGANRYDDFALLDASLRQQVDMVALLHNHENIAQWLSRRGVPFSRLTHGTSRPIPGCVGAIVRDDSLAIPEFAARCRAAGLKSILQVSARHSIDLSAPGALAALGGARVETWRVPSSVSNDPLTGIARSRWAVGAFARRLAKGRAWLPELIFFDDDHTASGALLALGAAGVEIPRDVRVATWANREYGPVWLRPLSRMEMDNTAIGQTVAHSILDYLRTGAFPAGITVGPTFIPGDSM